MKRPDTQYVVETYDSTKRKWLRRWTGSDVHAMPKQETKWLDRGFVVRSGEVTFVYWPTQTDGSVDACA